MKHLIYFIILCPIFLYSQKTKIDINRIKGNSATNNEIPVYNSTDGNFEPGDPNTHLDFNQPVNNTGTLDGLEGSQLLRNDNKAEYTRQLGFNMVTLSGTSINWNLDTAQVVQVTLTGNTTINNPTNQQAGTKYTLLIKQDATGSRTLSFGTSYKFQTYTLNSSANGVTVFEFISDGTNMYGNAWNIAEALELQQVNNSNLILWAAAHRVSDTYQDQYATSRVSSNGDSIKNYFDPSYENGSLTSQPSESPTYTVNSGNSAWYFDGVNDALTWYKSKNIGFVSNTRTFAFFFRIKANRDATNEYILSMNDNGSDTSINLIKTVSNTLNFKLFDGASNQVNATTTETLTVSDGWTDVYIQGNGTQLSIKIGTATAETFAINSASITDYDNDFRIGNSYGSAAFQGYISLIAVYSDTLSSSELSTLSGLSFTETKAPLINDRDAIFAHYDFSNSSKLFTDISKTTTPTDGQSIAVVGTQYNRTIYERDLIQSTSSTQPTYQTNEQNSLSIGRFDGVDDIMGFENTRGAPLTIFIVFKADTIDFSLIRSSNDKTKLSIDCPFQDYQGVFYSQLGQFIRYKANNVDCFTPVQSLKSLCPVFMGWNILEFTKSDSIFTLAVNGDNYVTGSIENQPTDFEQISGDADIGEIYIYSRPLSEGRRNVLRQNLATKWNIPVINNIQEEELDVITVLDYTRISDNDYLMQPTGMLHNDTVHMVYTRADNHNTSIDSDDAITYAAFNKFGKKIVNEESVANDDVSNSLNVTTSGLTRLSDGRLLVVYGRRAVGVITTDRQLYFKIRSTAGVWSSETHIDISLITPAWSWAMAQQGPLVENGSWYLPIYGNDNTSSSDPYQIRIIKSSNEGLSWTEVLRYDGVNHSPNISPEEPQLKKLSNNEFLLLIREDINRDIYSWHTTDIENWDTAKLKYAFEGANYPNFTETNTGKIVVANRSPEYSEAITYVVSNNFGHSWSNLIELNPYRNDHDWRQIGGFPVDIGNGKVGIYYCSDASSGGTYTKLFYQEIQP